jgi:hypothetical protein
MLAYKRLLGGAIAAAGLALIGSGAQAALFNNTGVTVFATQAVASASPPGTVTINGTFNLATAATGASFCTAAGTPGSFILTLTLPAGTTFNVIPTLTSTNTLGGSVAALPATGTTYTGTSINGGNAAVYTIGVPGGQGTVGGTGLCTATADGTLTFSGFQVAGATALSSTTGAGKFQISEQVSASTGVATAFTTTASSPAGLNQPTPTKVDLAQSANAFNFANVAAVPATINVLPPSNGTKITQGGSTNGVVFDGGNLQAGLNTGLNATATAQFQFSAGAGATLNVTATGNFTGANNAYIAPPNTAASLSCASTFGGRPSGSLVGSISGNTITFSGVATGFDATPPLAVATVQEICIYYTGTTIIGQNPGGNLITVNATVDTTTSPSVTLSPEAYNGVVAFFTYTGSFTGGYTVFVRVTNGTAGPVQAFAVAQSDSGSTGQTQVESALAANSSNAGVSLTNGRASIVLLGPNGIGFSQLLVSPNGTVNNLF